MNSQGEYGKSLLIELQHKLSKSTIQVIFRIINKCLNHAKKNWEDNNKPILESTIAENQTKRNERINTFGAITTYVNCQKGENKSGAARSGSFTFRYENWGDRSFKVGRH